MSISILEKINYHGCHIWSAILLSKNPEPEITPLFDRVHLVQSLVFYVVFCVKLLVCLSFSLLAIALSVNFQHEFESPFCILRLSFIS